MGEQLSPSSQQQLNLVLELIEIVASSQSRNDQASEEA